MATQSDYIKNAIIEAIKDTTDEGVLNYIYTALMNALVAAETPQADS